MRGLMAETPYSYLLGVRDHAKVAPLLDKSIARPSQGWEIACWSVTKAVWCTLRPDCLFVFHYWYSHTLLLLLLLLHRSDGGADIRSFTMKVACVPWNCLFLLSLVVVVVFLYWLVYILASIYFLTIITEVLILLLQNYFYFHYGRGIIALDSHG